MDTLGIVVSLVVGALLLTSGVAKIRTGDVVAATAKYKLVPERLLRAFAFLPWLECILGTCLVLGLATRLALLLTATLLAGFATAITVNMLRRRFIDCGCRATRRPIGWRLAVENAGLSVACVIAAVDSAVPAPLPSVIGRSSALSAMEAIALVLLATQAVILYQISAAVPKTVSAIRLATGISASAEVPR